MSQIAQQDHLYIEVANIDEVTDAETPQIVSAWKRNVLDDVILVSPFGHSAVVAWNVDDADAPTELNVYAIDGGSVLTLAITL